FDALKAYSQQPRLILGEKASLLALSRIHVLLADHIGNSLHFWGHRCVNRREDCESMPECVVPSALFARQRTRPRALFRIPPVSVSSSIRNHCQGCSPAVCCGARGSFVCC